MCNLTPRQKLLNLAINNSRFGDLDVVKFNNGVERAKDRFVGWLAARRCPMYFSGLVFHSVLVGGISPERKRVILFELEQEKRIVRHHMPDGLYTFEAVISE